MSTGTLAEMAGVTPDPGPEPDPGPAPDPGPTPDPGSPPDPGPEPDPAPDSDPDPTPDPEPTPEPDSPDDAAREHLIGKIRDRFGIDLEGKYQDLDKLIDGLGHAARMVGQRNEAAQQWQTLVERVGEDNARLLLQQQAAAAPSKDALPTWDDLQRLRQRAPTNPEAKQQVEEINERFGRDVYEIARRFGELTTLLDRATEGQLLTREEAARQQAQDRQMSWLNQHAAELYADGQVPANPTIADLTPLGRKAAEYATKGMNWQDALAEAKAFAAAQEAAKPKPQSTRRPNPKARASVPVASPATQELGFDDVWNRLQKEQGNSDGILAELAKLNTQSD